MEVIIRAIMIYQKKTYLSPVKYNVPSILLKYDSRF